MERIAAEVERELRRGGSRDALPLAKLVAAWPEAVGETIARHAWPLRVARDGTLHVATSSAAWASELTLLAEHVLDGLRDHLGPEAPAQLRCAVGPVPESGAAASQELPAEVPEASPETLAAATAVTSAIDDPELRELVARAARVSLGRGASDRHF